MSAISNSQLLLEELMRIAESDFQNERRTEARLPFFRGVSIVVDGYRFSGFLREISLSSVGLLHNMELPLKEVKITVSGQREGFHVAIVRCQPCGEGWYLSGGKVIDRD
jgi:hypothetical protein